MSVSHTNLAFDFALADTNDTTWTDNGPNGYTLGEQNSVTHTTAPWGVVASFNGGDNQRLFIADQAGLRVASGTSFCLGCWVWSNDQGGGNGQDAGLISKCSGNAAPVPSASNCEYFLNLLQSDGGGNFVAFGFSDGSNLSRFVSTNTYSDGAWQFIYAYYDASIPQAGISINGAAADTFTPTHGTANGTRAFQLGKLGSSSLFSLWLDGKLGRCFGFIGRVLTSGELTDMYNAGSGLDYPWTTVTFVSASDSCSTTASDSSQLTGLLSRIDTTSVSAVDSSSLLAMLLRTDTASLSIAEVSTLLASLSRSDSASVAADDDFNLLALLTRVDSLSVQLTDLAERIAAALTAGEQFTLPVSRLHYAPLGKLHFNVASPLHYSL